MTTQVWINTRGWISEETRTAIQEALEEESTKDTPSFGTKTSRKYIDPVQKQAS